MKWIVLLCLLAVYSAQAMPNMEEEEQVPVQDVEVESYIENEEEDVVKSRVKRDMDDPNIVDVDVNVNVNVANPNIYTYVDVNVNVNAGDYLKPPTYINRPSTPVYIPDYPTTPNPSASCSSETQVLYDPSGEIRVWVDPHYESDLTCPWLIIVDPGNVIFINWISLDLEGSGCIYDYVEIYDLSTDKLLGHRFCGEKLPDKELISTSNQVLVIFHTDSSVEFHGFILWYTSGASPTSDTPISSSSLPTSDIPISSFPPPTSDTPISSSSLPTSDIPISYFPPPTSDIPISYFPPPTSDIPISYFPPPTSDTPISFSSLPTSDTPISSFPPPTSDTPISSASLPTSDTPISSSSLPTSDTPISSSSLPTSDTPISSYPPPTSDTPISSSSLPTSDTPISSFPPPTSDTPISSSSLPTSDIPTSELASCNSETTEVLEGRTGVISVWSEYHHYERFLNCSWLIKVHPVYEIFIYWIAFNLQGNEPACIYDYVEVYDEVTGELLGRRFCGDLMPDNLHSTSNKVLVRFVTDEIIERQGFILWYRSDEAPFTWDATVDDVLYDTSTYEP